MSVKTVNVAVIDNQTITESVQLRIAKQGQPARIKAVQNGKYVLAEQSDKAVAPENIMVKRVGQDLHVATEGTAMDQPQLIIEGFYDSQSQLVGVGENGGYYEYLSSGIGEGQEAAFLKEGVSSSQALGTTQLPGLGEGLVAGSGIGSFWPALLGLGALGVLGGAYAVARHNDNDNNDNNDDKAVNPLPSVAPAIGLVSDDQGSVTGSINRDGVTDDSRPTFNGTALANSTIILYDNGVEIGRVPVDATGNWTFTPAVALANGAHEVTIVAQDAAGNQSVPSAGFNFELVAGGAPPAPAITGINDDVADAIGNVSPGGTTNDATPEIMGTALAGSTVSVFANGVLLGTTMADANGAWRFSPATPLADGVQNISASASNAAGNVSPVTGDYTIIIDTSSPVAATGSELVDDVGLVAGSIADGDTTDDSTPILNGRAEANSTVIISDNGVEIGRVLADANGAWTFTPAPALVDGPHSLSTVVVDAAGNRSPESAAIGFVVDTSAVAISITQVTDDAGANQGFLASGSVTDDTTPTLSGQATAGSTVNVYLNGQLLQSGVPVNAAGEWTYTVAPALAEGSYAFSAAVVTAAGGVSAPTADFTLEIDTTPPAAPVIDDVSDDVGAVQGSVANGDSTDDTTPTLSGSGVAGDVIIISDNGIELGRTTVSATGTWSFTPSLALNDGSHEFTLVAQDPAGNLSAPSAGYSVIIDTVPPVVPVVGVVIDDPGNGSGPTNPGDIIENSRPTFNGIAQLNSIVVVYDNGVEIGRAPVNAFGVWSFTPITPLADGLHEMTVAVQDAAGNLSAQSVGFGFELLAVEPPPAPTITGINDDVADMIGNVAPGGSTNDATPQIIGTALAGSTVSVFANGMLLGTTVADAVTGAWSFTPDLALTEGVQNITASASNASGYPGPLTGDYTIVIDTSAPAAATDITLIDDIGEITGTLASGDTTDDNAPTLYGMAEANSTVIISDNGVEIGRVTANANGAWTFTPAPALVDGAHSLSTVVVDAAGNRSPESAAVGFVVDTSAVVVSITQVTDDVGQYQGPLANGSLTDDTTPTLSGQATPGGTVNIYRGGELLASGIPVNAAGEWTYTVAPALDEGVYSFNATVTTAVTGESEPTPTFTLEVRTTPSYTPVIDDVLDDVGAMQGSVAYGASTDDTTPTLSGIGVAGDVIIISDNGVELGRTTVDATGAWSFTPSLALNDGSHEFTLVAQDSTGNQSPPSGGYIVIVDTAAPALPTIGSVIDDQGDTTGPINSGAVTDDSQPTFSGTAQANGTAILYDNGVEIGRAPVDATGNWTFTPTTPLANGQHEVTVAVQDAAGNVSGESAGFGFELVAGDALAPPTITGINDDVADMIGNVAPGDSTNDAAPEIMGTALAGSTVSVFANGMLLGTTMADAVTGAWSFTPATPLTDGVQNITASASNAAGNVSPATGDYTIIIDTLAPVAATSSELIDDVGAIIGPIANGDTTDDSTPTFNGMAEANSTVIISDNGVEIGRVLADATGAWTFTPATALIDGAHSLSTVVVDAAGNRSPESAAVGFVVDTSTVVVSITQVTDDAGLIQGPLVNGSLTDDTTPTLSGRATPGGTVSIYNGGELLASGIPVNAAGEWTYTVAPALDEGVYAFNATVTTAVAGESEPTATFTLEVRTTPSYTPVIDDVLDDVGAMQGSVAYGTSTDDTTPTLSGIGVAGDVIIISDNGVELGRTTVDATGAWSFTPSLPLNDGSHEFTLVAQDSTGNQSPPSGGYIVIVDTAAPALPTIGSVIDDQGDTTGPINSGAVTDDSQPTFSGTAQANGTAILYDNGVEIGRAPVDATGNWTFTPTTPLANGQHEVTVAVQDAAGNVSGESAGFGFELVAGDALAAPTITGINDDVADVIGNVAPGGSTNDAAPEIMGTALAGSTVSVFANGMLLGTTLADAVTGAWSFTPATPLADGVQTITASVTNDAGNTSPVTGDYAIIIDTLAPVAATDIALIDDIGGVTGTLVEGDITDDNAPTLYGMAQANSTVIISDNGVEIGRVLANANGAWMFTPAPALVDGPHSLSTVVLDAAGNRSPQSAAVGFVVDTTAAVISITQVTDDAGQNQGVLASGSVTDDTTPTLSGQATPGGTVNIYLGGERLAVGIPVNAAGEWTYTVAPPLAQGVYAFNATVTTAVNGESAPTAVFDLTIDTTAPSAPVIDEVLDDVGAVQAPVANGASTDDTTPTLSGSGVQEDVIIIRNNGVEIGRTTVGADGRWSFTPGTPLNNGSTNSFDVIAQDVAGHQSPASDAWVVVIDTVVPAAPQITSLTDDAGDVTGSVNAGDSTDDARPLINGSAEPGSTVTILVGGVAIGIAQADGVTGAWSFQVTEPLAIGNHTISAFASDAAGSSSDSADFDFSVVQLVGAMNAYGFEDEYFRGPIPAGDVVNFTDFFSLTVLEGFTTFGTSSVGIGRSLSLTRSSTLRFDFAPAETFTFTVVNQLPGGTPATVVFYDAYGVALGSETFEFVQGAPVSIVTGTAPVGNLIAYAEFVMLADAPQIYIDNFEWGPRPITPQDAGYDDVESEAGNFMVNDVSAFEQSDQILHGDAHINVLEIVGENQVIDLSLLLDQLVSIEAIDLTGSSNNTLNISLGDILALGETSLFTGDGTVQMLIKGGAGDVVNLDDLLADGTDPGDWANLGLVKVEGVTYDVYQHSSLDAELLVQQGVTTNVL